MYGLKGDVNLNFLLVVRLSR